MKKMFFMAVLALLPMLASAEEAKFGYISSYDVMTAMPEVAKVEEYMADYNKKNREYLETMYNELQEKAAKYEADKATLSEAMRKVREEEVQTMYERFQNAQTSFQEDAQKEQALKLEPIRQKLQDAINAVGKRLGLVFVFDTSAGSPVLYKSEKAVDITSQVKKELGML
ncbi:MAG: OmpH family outer membrane protein [Paludibacteraceae bacterium]|nr:OmpH family outer membrane protein [Paludibacteraceae bacterium]